MSIHYAGSLESLIVELENRGFIVSEARHTGGYNGATDLLLRNGALVRFDAQIGSVWATGPLRAVQRVEACLRRPPALRAAWRAFWFPSAEKSLHRQAPQHV